MKFVIKSKKLLQKINYFKMNKLEKLREICTTLDDIIIKKETYIFVENINTDKKNEIKEPQPKKLMVDIKTIM